MASPSEPEQLVFTLPPTKCTDGVDRRCEATPAPDSLGWSATPPYGQPVSLYGDQYAFGLHGTTHQHNTHISDVREICYSWHPWHDRAVRLHASIVKRDQAVAYCSLEDVPACRVLEVPLWMLDVAACCKTRISKPGFASAQSLRDLKEVLQAARPGAPAPIAPKTQPRYLLHAGGADGDIDGPAEIEPTPVVCSSAMQPTLDESVVRCSTKDRASAGAVTETASCLFGKDA